MQKYTKNRDYCPLITPMPAPVMPAFAGTTSSSRGREALGRGDPAFKQPHNYQEYQGSLTDMAASVLLYYELHEEMLSAIAREKQIKAGSRK